MIFFIVLFSFVLVVSFVGIIIAITSGIEAGHRDIERIINRQRKRKITKEWERRFAMWKDYMRK
jgi:predicted Holliday junction resolvase-like endonuclease